MSYFTFQKVPAKSINL